MAAGERGGGRHLPAHKRVFCQYNQVDLSLKAETTPPQSDSVMKTAQSEGGRWNTADDAGRERKNEEMQN